MTEPLHKPAPDDPALTTRDAAKLLGVSTSTAQKWVEMGVLPGWKTPGGHRRVRKSAVLGLLSLRSHRPDQMGDALEYTPDLTPSYPVGPDEASRLAAVRRSGLLDSGQEPGFDRLVWLGAELTVAPIALVTVLSRTRQWFKARIGLEATQTPREWAFCSHTVMQRGLFVVEDAADDPRFRDNPLVTGPPHIRFYAGYPFRDENGLALGALCVIDRRKRVLSPQECRAIRELASIATDQVRLSRLVGT